MSKSKNQTESIETVYNRYDQLELEDQIALFKLIKTNLEDKANLAKTNFSKLSEVVDKQQ